MISRTFPSLGFFDLRKLPSPIEKYIVFQAPFLRGRTCWIQKQLHQHKKFSPDFCTVHPLKTKNNNKTSDRPSPNYILSLKPTNQPTNPPDQPAFLWPYEGSRLWRGRYVPSRKRCKPSRLRRRSSSSCQPSVESRGGCQGCPQQWEPPNNGTPRDPGTRGTHAIPHVFRDSKMGSVQAGTHIPLGIRNWEWDLGILSMGYRAPMSLGIPWKSHWFVRGWVTCDVSTKCPSPNLPLCFFFQGFSFVWEEGLRIVSLTKVQDEYSKYESTP